MNNDLEQRLADYEKNYPVTNDAELIEALEKIIDSEEALHESHRNYELLEEAVDALLSLKGIDTEMLEKRSEEIAERHLKTVRADQSVQSRRNVLKLKYLVPVAALISLVLVGTMVASAGKHNNQNESFVNLESRFIGNADINSSGEYYEFSSLEELLDLSAYDSLVKPTETPKGYTVDHLSVQRSCLEIEDGYLVDYTLLDMVLVSSSDRVTVKVESPAFNYEAEGVELTIDGKSVYCRELNGEFCGSFMMNGQAVTVTSTKFHTLKNVVFSVK